jgi:membrane protein YqaA with SNARE-associated domain
MDYLYLLFSAFISATIFPMGSEALFIYYINQNLNIYILLFLATFGNSLGSVVNYWFGYNGEDYLEKKKILKSSQLNKYRNLFNKYGSFSLLLSWMPIIGDPITIIAGLLKYNIYKFILLVTFAKFFRYLFVAYLVVH